MLPRFSQQLFSLQAYFITRPKNAKEKHIHFNTEPGVALYQYHFERLLASGVHIQVNQAFHSIPASYIFPQIAWPSRSGILDRWSGLLFSLVTLKCLIECRYVLWDFLEFVWNIPSWKPLSQRLSCNSMCNQLRTGVSELLLLVKLLNGLRDCPELLDVGFNIPRSTRSTNVLSQKFQFTNYALIGGLPRLQRSEKEVAADVYFFHESLPACA